MLNILLLSGIQTFLCNLGVFAVNSERFWFNVLWPVEVDKPWNLKQKLNLMVNSTLGYKVICTTKLRETCPRLSHFALVLLKPTPDCSQRAPVLWIEFLEIGPRFFRAAHFARNFLNSAPGCFRLFSLCTELREPCPRCPGSARCGLHTHFHHYGKYGRLSYRYNDGWEVA